ncbi:MAG: DegT/DnrJ/EryC1/StrS family aminotransferase [Candidatus Micrarchaeia archaeon]
MEWKVPLYKIYSDEDDVAAASTVIRRRMGWANGQEIGNLEKELACYTNRKYALAFNNGTSALHALLLAYDIKKNDEIIVPSFTFISTANAALFTGAKPVFADIENKTYALDAVDIRKKITKKTKAILPIHYAGCPAVQIEQIRELAQEKDLLMLEDAAEALGAKLNNKKTGTFGDSAMFSFCANKIITGGEGGAIVTDSEEIYEKLKLIRSHGRLETENYFETTKFMDYVSLGYNFRMPTIIAAIILSQLRKIDRIISLRRNVAKQYSDAFSKKFGLLPDDSKIFNIYQMYSLLTKNRKDRDDLQKSLSANGIMSRVYFPPVNGTYFYKKILGHAENSLPVTYSISDRVLSIPIFADMKQEEIDLVINSIRKTIGDKND